ncbi:MAG: type II toxin-antitoxin system VapC family toxin [Acidobacteriaceae bacterium]
MILLDTQAVAWMVSEPERLSKAAHSSISEARRGLGVAISDKTLWELAMMVTKGRVKLSITLQDYLREVERVCAVLPIDAAIADRSMRFSERFPRDPSDKIIAATAIVHGLKLVTSDKPIRKSGEVSCIW